MFAKAEHFINLLDFSLILRNHFCNRATSINEALFKHCLLPDAICYLTPLLQCKPPSQYKQRLRLMQATIEQLKSRWIW